MGWSDNTGGGVELRHYRFFRFFIGYPVYAVAPFFLFFGEGKVPFFGSSEDRVPLFSPSDSRPRVLLT